MGLIIPYSLFLPSALAFAQRALAAAAIFARAAALILRRAFLTGSAADFRPLIFAHRALAAAAIFRLPAALIFRRLRGAAAPSVLPNSRVNCFCNDSILCLILAARRSCLADRCVIVNASEYTHRCEVKLVG